LPATHALVLPASTLSRGSRHLSLSAGAGFDHMPYCDAVVGDQACSARASKRSVDLSAGLPASAKMDDDLRSSQHSESASTTMRGGRSADVKASLLTADSGRCTSRPLAQPGPSLERLPDTSFIDGCQSERFVCLFAIARRSSLVVLQASARRVVFVAPAFLLVIHLKWPWLRLYAAMSLLAAYLALESTLWRLCLTLSWSDHPLT
jgi:hypothetical protein